MDIRTIETDSLILRPWKQTKQDAEDIFHILGEESTARKLGALRVLSLEQAKALLEEYRTEINRFAVVLKETGRAVGIIFLKGCGEEVQKDDALELGYCIASEVRGRGYAQEAINALLSYGFGVLHLKSIVACCLESNLTSQHILDNFGFSPVGDRMEELPGYCDAQKILIFQLEEEVWRYGI